ncbi:MAG: ABC transporter permease [Calditrichaeota bacterium]|nr:ABC transporter permease [Calditrichota bacterium]RQV92500.1 MAG: ABC transporter permease [bacterium]RQV99356.1 MAG: ABC transporter permease [Calditrichota bacterium]
MKRFLIITWWEFLRHFKSRSFLLSTFISPVIFAGIILIPALFLEDPSANRFRLIGCLEFDTTGICGKVENRLVDVNAGNPLPPFLRFVTINPDTSPRLKERFQNLTELKMELDSLEDTYNTIKERRKFIFQKPRTPGRESSLRSTYDDLIQTREARDLMQLEYQQEKQTTDSLWRIESIEYADNLLNALQLEGYLLIDPEEFRTGMVEFHSLLPSNFLEIDPLKEAVQIVIVEQRLKDEGLRVDKIEEWLDPIKFREIQLQGEEKEEFDFIINYLGPIIIVLFLFISIFTSSGFLFGGVIKEKTNRVIELLLSSVNHQQLMAGKIIGLGLLGIFQIVIWYGLVLILIAFNVFTAGEVTFLTAKNAGLFLLYFVLGYLYFASIFVGIGSLFSNEEDAHHLNQFMRMLSIFPIVLAILVLETPGSLLVRILSFIPPLTPTFMILRTPLGNPPAIDYLISVGIMLISIMIGIFVAGRLFRIGTLSYGKKPGIREIFSIMLSGK